jgi:hypothetical protein
MSRAFAMLLALAAALPGAAAAQTFTRVSIGLAGAQPDGRSANPSISGNGRFIAFESTATNLVAGDTNQSSDIFVHDRQTGTTSRVSVTSAGEERSGDSVDPHITPDGRFVVFGSGAALVADDTNGCTPSILCTDIYLHDRQTGTTTRVSVGAAGAQADAACTAPRISDDGRIVVFNSSATSLVPLTGPSPNTFVKDLASGLIELVNLSPSGERLTTAFDTSLSGDGRFLLMQGYYLRDLTARITTSIDLPPDPIPVQDPASLYSFYTSPAGGIFEDRTGRISRDGGALVVSRTWTLVAPIRPPSLFRLGPDKYLANTYRIDRATGSTHFVGHDFGPTSMSD